MNKAGFFKCHALRIELAQELALYDEALNLYRTQIWHLADEKFSQLQRLYPERYLYKMYVKRIAYFAEHSPGASWDGSFTFITK
jgi:adenylate cyclase